MKLSKKRNVKLHEILTDKRKSGSSGKHKGIKDKEQIKRIVQNLMKKEYYG